MTIPGDITVQTYEIAQIIQLVIAPVFLIAGIGSFLSVLTSRLARVVDRYRAVEQQPATSDADPSGEQRQKDLHYLDIRMSRINRAIKFSTIAALLVCLVIIALFMEEVIEVNASILVAMLFVATMVAMVVALLSFLGEIRYAEKMLMVRRDLL